MRKNAGFMMLTLLLLLVPALANAWTLTVKVAGGNANNSVAVTYPTSVGSATLSTATKTIKSGTAYLYPSKAGVTVAATGTQSPTITLDGAAYTAAALAGKSSGNHVLQVVYPPDGTAGLTIAPNLDGGQIYAQNRNNTWSSTGVSGLPVDSIVPITIAADGNHRIVSYDVGEGDVAGDGSAGQVITTSAVAEGQTVTASFDLVAKTSASLFAPTNAVAGKNVSVTVTAISNDNPLTYAFVVNGAEDAVYGNSATKTFPAAGTSMTVAAKVKPANGTIFTTETATIVIADAMTAANSECTSCHTSNTPAVVTAYLEGPLAATTPCITCHTASAPHDVGGPYTHKAVENSAGRKVAAGSDVCLVCHTDKTSWASTPHTQKAQMGKEYVVGYNANPANYTGAAKWITDNRETYLHPSNKNADGTAKDPTKLGVRAIMTEKPTVTYSDRTFGVEDITVVIGSNHKQAYAVWMPGYGNKILNIRYNNLDPGLTPSMGDRVDERVWEGSCIGCHVTGAEPEKFPAGYEDSATPVDLSSYMGDLRIGCEACHGPASGVGIHSDETGHAINPANLTQDQQIDICGRCHGNWNSTVPGTTARKDVPEFKAGDSLEYLLSPAYNGGVDRIRRPSWNAADIATKPFLGNGASNDDHQQWYDIKIGNHYGTTVTCTTCHDPHMKSAQEGRVYGRIILKGNYIPADGKSDICKTCHEGDTAIVGADGYTVTKKGKTGAINPHTAKPYGEGVDLDPVTPGAQLPPAGSKWPWE